MALALPPPLPMQEGEDFCQWIQMVEVYMAALNITGQNQKKNIVLHLLGPQMQEIYRNLPEVTENSGGVYADMKTSLTEYFKPAVNHVVERHVFHQMKYNKKSVGEYVAALKSQAAKCNFGQEELQTQLRDKLVSTCPDIKLKQRMLREENLDLNMAIKIWSTDEHVKKQSSRRQQQLEEKKKRKKQ